MEQAGIQWGSVMGTPLLLELRGAVAVVRLNEPATLNALSPGIKAGMLRVASEVLPDPDVRALLITGTGRAFCAGVDVRSLHERASVPTLRWMQTSYDWVRRLLMCDKPIVTAVNGVAAGAGFALALFGDIVCAADDARFKAAFAGIGAAPDFGLGYLLPRAVGTVRARDILLLNEEVPAQAALEMGLVSRVFPAAELEERALELAERLAAGPTVAHGLAKRLVARAHDLTLDAFLEREALAQLTAIGSEDFSEGIAAFRAKRKPVFHGR